MSIKTTKRLALGVIAALVFAPFVAIAPASANFGTTITVAGTNVARSGVAGASVLLTAGTPTAGNTLIITLQTRNGVTLNAVPAGITFTTNGANTGFSTTGAVTTLTVANANQTETNIVVADTVPAGKYTFSAITNTASAVAKTGEFYVSTAPTKATFNKATYSAEGTATAAATVALTDVNGNPTYLISPEAVQITSSAAAAVSSVILLDSGNYTQAVGTTGNIATNLSNSAGTAGTYTYTVSGASGQVGFTSGTATLTVSAAAATVETVTLAAGTLARGHVTGTPSTTLKTSAAGTNDTGATTDIFPSTKQTSITYKLVDTAETAAKNFRYAISQTAGVPFPGGIAAVGPVYLPAAVTTAGSAGISADLTITTTSALAGTGYTLTILGTAANIVYTVLYQAPVAYNVVLANSEASTLAALKLATTSQSVKVTDQFGSVFAGATIVYTTATRNTVAAKSIASEADGTATISTTDAALASVTTDDVLTATITAANITGGPNAVTSAATTIKYYADAAAIAAATVTLAVTQPTTPGTTATYDATITTSTTAAVTVDTNLTNGSDALKIADQIAIAGTIANAAAAGVQGIPVTVTGTAGVFFLQGNAVGEVLVGAQTGAKTTLTSFTGAAGAYNFQAAFTKSGTATITVTSGTASKTFSIKVNAGSLGIVTAAATGSVVTATVTDLWGNPVSGQNVTFTAAGGAQLGGNFANLVGVTATNGTAQVAVSSQIAGTYVVTAAITGGDSATAADTTNKVPAGVASATASVTVAGPPVPEVVYDKPTLSFVKDGGRIILSGTAVDGEGDIIIYTKQIGTTAWKERAKTLETAAPGDYNGSIKALKNNVVIRVKQEGTGLFSNQIIVLK